MIILSAMPVGMLSTFNTDNPSHWATSAPSIFSYLSQNSICTASQEDAASSLMMPHLALLVILYSASLRVGEKESLSGERGPCSGASIANPRRPPAYPETAVYIQSPELFYRRCQNTNRWSAVYHAMPDTERTPILTRAPMDCKDLNSAASAVAGIYHVRTSLTDTVENDLPP